MQACLGIVALLLVTPAVSAHPDHHWHMPVFGAPGIGTQIVLHLDENHSFAYAFKGEGDLLAGHFEERRAAFVDQSFIGSDWNHSWPHAFDLGTGLLLGTGYDHSFQNPWPIGNLGPLTQSYEYRAMYGSGPSIDGYLPESLLWGRGFWPGESWTVHSRDAYCAGEDTATVTTSGAWNGTSVADLAVVIAVTCVVGDVTHDWTWTLGFGDGPWIVAEQRELSVVTTYADGSSATHGREMPASLIHNTSAERLEFRGQGDVPFWAPRDQSMGYGVGDIFPADPEPHALFDIAEAGRLALQVDDEDVRVFLSRAEDLHLFGAHMRSSSGAIMYWTLEFYDGAGHLLRVDITGLKLPDQPLVVSDAQAEAYDFDWPWDGSYDGETAYVGDMARRSDAYFAANGARPVDYAWSDHPGSVPRFSATGDHSTLPGWLTHDRETVMLDATAAIVVGQQVHKVSYSL